MITTAAAALVNIFSFFYVWFPTSRDLVVTCCVEKEARVLQVGVCTGEDPLTVDLC